jgi:hypothetical protein
LGLLLHQGGQGALGQASGGGRGDLLHRIQIDIGSRPGVTEGMTGNDLAPASSQLPDFLEVLGGEIATWHGQSCLVLAKLRWDAFLLPL